MKSAVKEDHMRRCVHFYACICAFASDERLSEEFAYYINLDNQAIAPMGKFDLFSLHI